MYSMLVKDFISLEHAPFPKVIRYKRATGKGAGCLEHAPFPKVIRLHFP